MPTLAQQLIPPNAKRIEIHYRCYPLQTAVHRDLHRIRVVCWGRRGGKSLLALNEGFCMSYDALQQGVTRPRGIITAPTNKMLLENWQTANTLWKQAITNSVISEFRLDLGALGQVDFRSTESVGGAGRGAGYHWAVIDEASRTPKDAYEADIRPALADTRGRSLLISTPNGMETLFYDLYQRGVEGDKDIAIFHASTLDCWRSRFANDPVKLAQMEEEWVFIQRTTSEAKFREEYLAEFLQDEGQLFSLKPTLYRGQLRDAVPGRHYLAGVDVARKEDWMCTAIIEEESQQLVGLTRSRHQDWALQKAASLALLDKFPGVLTYIDSTGVGDPIAQDYRRAGLNVEDVLFTPKRKSELIENLLMAIDQGYIGIPQEQATQWLIEELKQYQAFKQPSGAIKYGAPEGRHDDGVTALMLAAWGLQGKWRNPQAQEVITPNWWERDDPWAWLDYEHRVTNFRRRFPQSPAPLHPTDLAWSKMAVHN